MEHSINMYSQAGEGGSCTSCMCRLLCYLQQSSNTPGMTTQAGMSNNVPLLSHPLAYALLGIRRLMHHLRLSRLVLPAMQGRLQLVGICFIPW